VRTIRATGPERSAADVDDALVRRLLDAARQHTGMETAWLSRLAGSEQSFEFVQGQLAGISVEGTSVPASESYCARVLDQRLPNVVPDTRSDPRTVSLAGTRQLGIASYAGVPVRLGDGEVYGVLACVSAGVRPGLGDRAIGSLEVLAGLLGTELQAQRQRREAAECRRQAVVDALEAGLEIVYQPIVDLRTGAIVGAEALARFAAPPADPELWFRDAADVQLGQDLQLAAVAEALRHLDELPPDVYLAVNASPSVIIDPRLHALVAPVAAGRLVVEITEHAAVDDYEELAEAIATLRAQGVRLAIDDAGAGFSSLRHVLRLRPDIIKLDMSITRNVDSDPVRRALAEALVTFAGVVGATLVAEGVESRGELDALLALGASSAQGFFLRRPAILPLPDEVPGPTPRIVRLPAAPPPFADVPEGPEPDRDDLTGLVMPMLDEILALTGLECAYVATLDHELGIVEAAYVRNTDGYHVPLGAQMPWEDSLSKICHDRGIRWTAEVPDDLGDRATYGVQTYVSVPVEAPDGRLLGSLAAASVKRRYLDAAAYARLQVFARTIAERMVGDDRPARSARAVLLAPPFGGEAGTASTG
jgi:EAL domain-containing protein (putative c-di-GMP-specific phosphodiesterase class I)